MTVNKFNFAQKGTIHVHQARVKRCPAQFPLGFYWYGTRSRGPGRPPKWVAQVFEEQVGEKPPESTSEEPEPEPDGGTTLEEQESSSRGLQTLNPHKQNPKVLPSLRKRSGRASS